MKTAKANDRKARYDALRLDAKRVQLARVVFGAGPGMEWGACGCDDFAMPAWMTAEDLRELDADIHTWNGDPENAGYPELLGWRVLFGYFKEALIKSAVEHHPS